MQTILESIGTIISEIMIEERCEEFTAEKKCDILDKPMVSDAALQFHSISSKQGLCWVYEIRHYRKLTPVLDEHRDLLKGFIDRLWHYYELPEDFKENPDCGFGAYLEWLFNFIFSPTAKTGYVMLDETIASTRCFRQLNFDPPI
jgi:hypothetical protein